METTLGVFAGVIDWISEIVSNLVSWWERPTTNGSIVFLLCLGYIVADRALEKRINQLRNLIVEIDDKRRGNWP
jgi:adenylosuccinate lyase